MVKCAGPDDIAETAGIASPQGGRFSVVRMARLLDVSTSGYYAHVKRAAAVVLTPRQQRRADLEVKITGVHGDSRGTYGSPRVTAELRDQGEVVTEKTVAKIMASIGLEGISPRTFKVKTTVVDPMASFPPDLVERVFDRGGLDVAWFTDITYLACGEGEMFLCAIRDGHSRKVLGYSIADHIGADMVTAAIDSAVASRGGSGRCRGTILHSDRGGEGGFNRWTQHRCLGLIVDDRQRLRRVSSSRVSCEAVSSEPPRPRRYPRRSSERGRCLSGSTGAAVRSCSRSCPAATGNVGRRSRRAARSAR
jgi:transposase InsO family protein